MKEEGGREHVLVYPSSFILHPFLVQPPSARMYFLAMRPVSISALRSWRLRLLVRPARRWRLLPLNRFSFPPAVFFILLATPLLVFCRLAMIVSKSLKARNPRGRPGVPMVSHGDDLV